MYGGSGYIGDLTAFTAATGSKLVPFGTLVSIIPSDFKTLLPGIPTGSIPVGILVANESKMQNDPAMPEGYFEGEAAAYISFGVLQYSKWGAGTDIKGPAIGSKVLAHNVTGDVGFIDFNDTPVPTGWTQLNAVVTKIDGPNGGEIFFGTGSLIVPGTGSDVTVAVSTPTATPPAGALTGGGLVTLACATLGATIYYTVDGSNPDGDSIQYYPGNPIQVTAAVTIKAIAMKVGMANSAVLTAAYTV
jgi:hypothetical protein